MDLLATKIALNHNVTQKDIWELIKEWLIKSPYYGIESIDYNGEAETYTQDFKNTSVNILKSNINDSNIFACRFTNHEDHNDWYTDVIYAEELDRKNLFIKLSGSSNSFSGSTKKINKPHIIKKLFECDYVRKDGLFPITDVPITLTIDKVSTFIDIISGKIEADLPVVYLSYDSYNESFYSVEPRSLAIRLSGLAHIVVEPNKQVADLLKQEAEGKNAYNGYVGIYYPGNDRGEILALSDFFRDGILDKHKFADAIYDRVRQALIYHSGLYNMSWDKLQLAFQKRKYNLRTKEAEQTTKDNKENKEYIALLEDEVKKNEQKIKELTDTVNDQRATIDTLNRKFESSSAITFDTSKIEEFYYGELNDLILNLLTQISKKIPDDTRPKELIEDFLSSNEFKNRGKKLFDKIEDALKEKSIQKRNTELTRLGFTLTEGPHDKAYFHKPEYSFTLAKTPSDSRSTKNILSDIKNALDIYKKYI